MDENKPAFKSYCETHGYTAREIATLVGVSLHTVRSYMQGARYPSRKVMKVMDEKLKNFDSVKIFYK